MNIFKYAVKACRFASLVSIAASRALSHTKPALVTFTERGLEIIARVLCVESHGVMVCGPTGASVAHLSTPHPPL